MIVYILYFYLKILKILLKILKILLKNGFSARYIGIYGHVFDRRFIFKGVKSVGDVASNKIDNWKKENT